MTTKFLLCFVPLFVAVDAIGVLPMFMGLTEDVDKKQVRRIVLQSVATAMAVSLAFVAIGELLLRLLGITVADFMIAGGSLLFGLSLTDLLTFEKQHRRIDTESLGAVPVGVPLIVGPAVLTTTILLMHQQGMSSTSIALVINILLAGVVLWFSDSVMKVLGKVGAKTVSKLANILLAAIGVMMVRKGIMIFIGH
jgi:multiple antibiotic resistance protein